MTEIIGSEYIPFSTGHLDFFLPLHKYENLGIYIGHLMANPQTHIRTIVKGFDILSISAVTIHHPGLGEVISIPSIKALDFPLSYIKETKKLLSEMCEDHFKCHRLQTAIRVDDNVSLNWIRKLGFTNEGVMKDWHKGQDHYLFARIKEWPQEQ
jgi:hypothetical protein